jgi:thioredoxin
VRIYLSTITTCNTDSPTTITVYADWCGPCKAIAPFYEQLATQLTRPNQITFTKVNTDVQRDIAQTYNITAMPTFMVFKNGRETQRIRGADPKALDAAVKSLASEAESSSADASSSASSSGTWIGASLPRGYSDITDSVDLLNLDFLNVDSEAGGARAVFNQAQPSALSKAKATAEKDWIESDTDDQLMLYIPFQSSLKVHGLHITSCPPEGDDDIVRPRTLKLYTNKSNVLSFDEAESIPSTQEITLQESDWDAKTCTARVDLRFVKFQNVTSLVVFVVEGDGDGEKTRVDRVKIIGETGEKRAMGKLEKIGDEQGE